MHMQACLLSKRCIADSDIERHWNWFRPIVTAVLTTVVARNILCTMPTQDHQWRSSHLTWVVSSSSRAPSSKHINPHVYFPLPPSRQSAGRAEPLLSPVVVQEDTITQVKKTPAMRGREEVTQLSLVLSPHAPSGKKQSGKQFPGPILPYSRKFSLVQIFTQIPFLLQKKILAVLNLHLALARAIDHTPLS